MEIPTAKSGAVGQEGASISWRVFLPFTFLITFLNKGNHSLGHKEEYFETEPHSTNYYYANYSRKNNKGLRTGRAVAV
jgi:hypothetical protein